MDKGDDGGGSKADDGSLGVHDDEGEDWEGFKRRWCYGQLLFVS